MMHAYIFTLFVFLVFKNNNLINKITHAHFYFIYFAYRYIYSIRADQSKKTHTFRVFTVLIFTLLL